MSDAILAAVIAASVLVYFVLVGVTWQLMPKSRDPYGPDAVIPAVFWPLALPVMLGARLVRRLTRPALPRATVRGR